MKFKVTISEILLENEEELNKGEYNIHTCEFTFDDVYNGLVKQALFTNKFGFTYQVDIINDKCDIPYEILSSSGEVRLGIIGYKITKDLLLEKRYSPKPISINISSGSYIEDVTNTKKPTPTELEQLNGVVQDLSNKIDAGSGIKPDDIVDNLTSESTDKVLSANQGRILNENINATNSTISTLSTNVDENTTKLEGISNVLDTKANKVDVDTSLNTKADITTLNSYFTKDETTTEINNAVSDKVDIATLDSYYTKTEVDTKITNATTNLTTKAYVDNAITTAINSITNGDEVTY